MNKNWPKNLLRLCIGSGESEKKDPRLRNQNERPLNMALLPRLLLIFVVTAWAVDVCAQETNTKETYRIAEYYDKFKDITITGLEPMSVPDSTVYLFAAFSCPGQRRCKPEGVILGFAFVSLSDERYGGEGIARAIRDGVRQEPHKLTYIGKMPVLIFNSHAFKAALSTEGFIKMAHSKEVEFQIDTTEFVLSPKNLEALRALTYRIQPF